MQGERVGFFQKIVISIKDFDKYIIFTSEKTSDSLKYLIKIMLIFALFISIGFTFFFYQLIHKGINYFDNNIKMIEFNGKDLIVNNNEPLIIENDSSMVQYIEINTSQTEDSYTFKDKADLYNTAIIILKDKMIIKIPIEIFEANVHSYEEIANEYNIDSFNKAQIVNFISEINKPYLYLAVYVSIYVYIFLVYTISSLFDILILTLLGYVIARIARINLKVSKVFNIGTHALTLPLILNLLYILINLFTRFTIKYFSWMYTTVSYIYVVVAILMIKTDIINTNIELAKIIKEQEKVRIELKQKDEEDNNKNSNNEKDKKEKKGKETESEEPDGSEA